MGPNSSKASSQFGSLAAAHNSPPAHVLVCMMICSTHGMHYSIRFKQLPAFEEIRIIIFANEPSRACAMTHTQL